MSEIYLMIKFVFTVDRAHTALFVYFFLIFCYNSGTLGGDLFEEI